MLSAEVPIRVDNGAETRPIREVREDASVVAARGWGEIGSVGIGDVFVSYDIKTPVLNIRTAGGHQIRCTPDHLCFGRFNPLSRLYHVYLMERSTMGFRVGLTQDLMKDVCIMQSSKLDEGDAQEIVDRIWLIEATENLPQAVFMAKYAAGKYGLPELPFTGKHATAELPDDLIREIYNRIDTPSRARQLLADSLMFEEHPHITIRLSKSAPSASNTIQFVIFGATEMNRERTCYAHLIRIDSSVELNRREHKAFKRRMNSRGLWNMEVARDDLEEAQLFVKTLSHLDNLEAVKKIQLSKKAPFYILPASHLKIGMTVPVFGKRAIEEDTVVAVAVETYEGPFYDLKVKDLQTYCAGDFVVMAYGGTSPGTPPLRRDVV